MASTKTWIWVIAGCLGAVVIALIAVAGAGVYFVAHHIHSEQLASADALRAFDDVSASFREQRPLYELDSAEQPRLARPLGDLPTSASQPDSLWILAWDPEAERLVKVSLPFWVLRMGNAKMKMTMAGGDNGFDLERLNLDIDELGRIGPALVFDFRGREGARVLLWTQ